MGKPGILIGFVVILGLSAREAAAQGGMDAFPGGLVSSPSATLMGSSSSATGETGEPDHAGVSGPLRSIWWTWQPPLSGSATITTFGSGYDTTLAVYTGAVVNALTVVASNDDASGGLQSSVTFTATAGTLYRVAVDGIGSVGGSIALNIRGNALTDSFPGLSLPNASGAAAGSNIGATGEAGEPDHAGASAPVASVWASWTAPQSTSVTIDTAGSGFDTTLAVYTGAAVGSLTVVASNNDAGGPQGSVTFDAVAGTAYRIAVAGAAGATGSISLNYRTAGDHFANSVVAPGGVVTGSNVGATAEPGEPNHASASSPVRSSWWRWTAPASFSVTLTTAGSDFPACLAVYLGSSVDSLSVVASASPVGNTSSVTFTATSGTTYSIGVAGASGAEGNIVLNLPATLTWSVNPAGGTVTRSPMGTNVVSPSSSGTSHYEAGTVVTLTANPSAGYEFIGWTGPVADPAAATTAVTLSTARSVTANFGVLRTLAFMTAGTAAGTIGRSPAGSDPGTPSSGGASQYSDGTLVTLTAIPDPGSLFVNWTGSAGTSTSPTLVLTMDVNHNVTANFVPATTTLTWYITGQGTVSRDPNGSNASVPNTQGTSTYVGGTVVTLTATPAPGWVFTSWTRMSVVFSTSAATPITLNQNQVVIANFVRVRTLTWSTANGLVTRNPLGSGFMGGSVSGTSDYVEGTVVGLQALADIGYTFAGWSGPVALPHAATTTVTMTADLTVTAFFAVEQALSLSVAGTATGTITRTPFGTNLLTSFPSGGDIYPDGAVVTVIALPGVGETFIGWTGPVENSTSSVTRVTMSGPRALQAIFAPLGNDAFAASVELTGNSATGAASNVGATGEIGEPDHAAASGPPHSLWWRWTATAAGSLTITAQGSDLDTTMGVYTGTAVDALATIASNNDVIGGTSSSVTFPVGPGTTYHVAVDGAGSDTGDLILDLEFTPASAAPTSGGGGGGGCGLTGLDALLALALVRALLRRAPGMQKERA